MSTSRVYGLTGGIACGKSTVAQMMSSLGAHIIDADQISREVVHPGSNGFNRVVEAFGQEIVDATGHISRSMLGQIIFAQTEARAKLEGILHPLIASESARKISEAMATDVPVILYEAALLIESGRADTFRPLIVVWSHPNVQRQRLKQRDQLSTDEITQRLSSQMSIEEKKTFGDHVIENNGTLETLREQTQTVWHEINRVQ